MSESIDILSVLCIYGVGVICTYFFCYFLRNGSDRKGDTLSTAILSIFSWVSFGILLIGSIIWAVIAKKKK